MPKIPVPEAPLARSQPATPFLSTDSPKSDLGSGFRAMGQGVKALGAGVSQADAAMQKREEARDAARKAEEIKAQDAAGASMVERSLAEFMDATHKDVADYRTNAKGENALMQREERRQRIEARRQQAGSFLPQGRIRDAFDKRSSAVAHQAYRDLESHEVEQAEALTRQSEEAVKKSTREGVADHAQRGNVLDPNHPSQDYIATYLGTDFEKKLAREGVRDRKVREQRIAEEKSEMHGIVMQGILKPAGGRPNFRVAKAYLDAHAGDLGPKLTGVFGDVIREGLAAQEAEDVVADVVQQNATEVLLPNGKTWRKVDEADVSAAIEALPLDADQKEATRRLGKQVASEATEQWKRTQDKVYSEAFSTYLQAPRRGMAGFNAIPVEVRVWLKKNDPAGYKKLEDMAKDEDAAMRRGGGAKKAAAPSAKQTDEFARFLVGSNDPKYKAADYGYDQMVREWGGGRLHPDDLEKVARTIAEKKGHLAGKTERNLPSHAVDQLLKFGQDKKFWPNLRDDMKKWDEKQAAHFMRIRARLEKDVAAYARDGEMPKPEWYTDWMQRNMLSEVAIPREPILGFIPNPLGDKKIPVIDQRLADEETPPGPATAPPASPAAPAPEYPSPVRLVSPDAPAGTSASAGLPWKKIESKPRRTDPKTGETRVWNETAWVKE